MKLAPLDRLYPPTFLMCPVCFRISHIIRLCFLAVYKFNHLLKEIFYTRLEKLMHNYSLRKQEIQQARIWRGFQGRHRLNVQIF